MNNKKLSQKLEKKAAKRFGGKTRIASGAFPRWKGDFTAFDGKILAEQKFVSGKSYSLKLEDVLTHEKYALLEGREWMWHIRFHTDDREIVVLDPNFLIELMERAYGPKEK